MFNLASDDEGCVWIFLIGAGIAAAVVLAYILAFLVAAAVTIGLLVLTVWGLRRYVRWLRSLPAAAPAGLPEETTAELRAEAAALLEKAEALRAGRAGITAMMQENQRLEKAKEQRWKA